MFFDWDEVKKELTCRWNETRWVATLMLDLLDEFQAEFKRQKEFQNGLTFPDQLQFALRLLRDPKTKEPTPIAESLRKTTTLFSWMNSRIPTASRMHSSRPSQTKTDSLSATSSRASTASAWPTRESSANMRKRHVTAGKAGTFTRSIKTTAVRPISLNLPNAFFLDMMKKEVGSVEFDKNSMLEACAPPVPSEIPRVQIIWNVEDKSRSSKQQKEDDASGEDLDTIEKEAILAAEKLLKLKETIWIRVDSHRGETSSDSPQTRPMEWSDVALLCRGGVEKKAATFIREFERRSIPIVAPGIQLFDCVEVMDLMNIIQLLDNPRQDYPLLGFLFSPFIRITKLEIIQLRTLYRHGFFWEAVADATREAAKSESRICREYPSLAQKLIDAQNKYQDWRGRLRYLTISDLLEKIIDDNGYEDCLYALPFPEQKIKNIRRFISSSDLRCSGSQSIPLSSISLRTPEKDSSDYTSANPQRLNAVQIRTVHKSGLEFPIVFLIGLGPVNKNLRNELVVERGRNFPANRSSVERLPAPQGYARLCYGQGSASSSAKRHDSGGPDPARDYLFLCLSAPAHVTGLKHEKTKKRKD